jgi:hypothetical protein
MTWSPQQNTGVADHSGTTSIFLIKEQCRVTDLLRSDTSVAEANCLDLSDQAKRHIIGACHSSLSVTNTQ